MFILYVYINNLYIYICVANITVINHHFKQDNELHIVQVEGESPLEFGPAHLSRPPKSLDVFGSTSPCAVTENVWGEKRGSYGCLRHDGLMVV